MRRILFAAAALAALGAGLLALEARTRATAVQTIHSAAAAVALAPTARQEGPKLPLSKVVLFSSGVGYFQREGEVEGNARIDLQFHTGDVNDLLKSLVLQDLGGGKVGTVSYDSQDPVEKTLRSFALDLTNNPTLGQLLNQARGEKVELVLASAAAGQPGQLSGTIVGMESQLQPHGANQMQEVHQLNLLCAEGIRSVKLADVQRLRFLNPTLDSELKRALEVLASAHDMLKKSVRLGFQGEGKRPVRVGYVVENPIWKTSYRLTLDGGKPALQGWASVENVTDEDWGDVRVVLVSGRPISFQTDLYQPLFVPRPTVEPERFASLRPPVYAGAMSGPMTGAAAVAGLGALGVGGGIGGIGGFGGQGGFGGGFGGGMQGMSGLNPYQGNLGAQFGNLGGQWGQQGGNFGFNRYQFANGAMPQSQLAAGMNPMGAAQQPQGGQPNQGQPQAGQAGAQQFMDATSNSIVNNSRLNYDQLQERRRQLQEQRQAGKDEAKKKGAAVANALDPHASIASAAAAEELGDSYQYVIQEKVHLPRQQSALLPIIDKPVEAARVSIYNESVHAKYPMLGLRFKNTTGMPLTQGAVTVYEGGAYAGDARIPDLQKDEERMVSYAVDLGTEVTAEDRLTPGPKMLVRTAGNVLHVRYTQRHTRTYTAKNRSPQDRTLVIEHPIRSDWKLTDDQKPRERSREVYRFDVKVKAGESVKFEVPEEQVRIDPFGQTAAGKAAPGEQALIFHTSLGFEVQEVLRVDKPDLLGVKVVKGVLLVTTRLRETRAYRVTNRSDEEREITVEHNVKPEWSLVGEARPVAGSTDLYRFPLKLTKGQTGSQTVVEERRVTTEEGFAAIKDEAVKQFLESATVSPTVKEALRKSQERRTTLAELQRQLAEIQKQLTAITEEQVRLRSNLEKVPSSSAAYKRYLEKFDKQETEIEKLQESLKQKTEAEKQLKKDLEEFAAALTVE